MYFRVLIISTLALFWLVLSGFWANGLLLTLGATSIALVVWLVVRVEKQYPFGNGVKVIHRLHRYMPWFFMEVVKSNIGILKSIWMPERYPISPVMRTLKMQPETRIGRTIYANSITLTPGTVTVDRRVYELESHDQEKAE